MLGRSREWLVTTTLVTPVAVAGWMLLAARSASTGEPADHWHCVATALFVGLASLVAFVAVHRQSDLRWPVATGAALGAAAGAWADSFMVLHCAANDLAHRLLCHLGPSALLVTLGAMMGAFVIRPRVVSEARERHFGSVRETGSVR